MRQARYERCGGYRISDHRPVRAVFDAVCELAGGGVGVEHSAAGIASFGHLKV